MRRRITTSLACGVTLLVAATLAGCSSDPADQVSSTVPATVAPRSTTTSSTLPATTSTTSTSTSTTTAPATTTGATGATAGPGPAQGPAPAPVPAPPPPTPPPGPGATVSGWEGVASVRGRQVAWRATASVNGVPVTLVKMDRALHLWIFPGGAIPPQYVANTAVAFNSAFKFGPESGIQTQSGTQGAINPGMAAVVGYLDNTTELGQWGRDVPNPTKRVAWVRTNLTLLVDGGLLSPFIGDVTRWGAPLNGYVTARSALGVDGSGSLIYAAVTAGNPDVLGVAMQLVGTQRAMELDMNPWWVLAYAFDQGRPWKLYNNPFHPEDNLFVTGWERDIFAATLD